MNNSYLVGRLIDNPQIKENENGKKLLNITLAVQRNYKNMDGIYENDYIDCLLTNQVAISTSEYCKKGDLVGVRGRLETSTYEIEKGIFNKNTQVVVDKLSFLAQGKD